MLDNLFSFAWKPLQPHAHSESVTEELWRSISLFNFYRLVLASLSVFLGGTFADVLSLGSNNMPLFFHTSNVYVVLVLISQLAIKLRKPRFGLQLAFQVGTDIVCTVSYTHLTLPTSDLV